MKRILILKYLIIGIILLIFFNIIMKYNLFFSNEIILFLIDYLKEKNQFLNVSNFLIWLFIISALIVTMYNKVQGVKKNN